MNSAQQPDYSQYSLHDFVLDDSFRQWVFEPDEQRMTFWHGIMLRHPEQQGLIDEAASLLLHLHARYDDLTDASQQRIWQVLDQAFDNQKATSIPVRPLTVWQRFTTGRTAFGWQTAASLTGLLLLAGGLVYYQLMPRQMRIHTAFGENRSVTLPDGSRVLLNGNTTLTYTDRWNDNQSREVWLDGEGFFTVTKKKSPSGRIKFVTHTPGLDITVLGTQFNVNTRRGNTAVTLIEGRVQLSKPNEPSGRVIDMKPGQFAASQPNIETVVVKPEKPQLHTSWVEHQFAFDDTPLSDIAQQLRDTYGLEVVFEDSDLASRRFTGNLSDQSIETLLTTLSLTFDLTVQRNGDRIRLRHNP
ncbi:FecR family protein [Spirosoma radiotolerans]|uniref:Iron dicitrate transport regulator FecR n=1 Tax=Spirosoma radiotolerans TaxID=1379870 RepID=A0A0E3V621_9BACT|nr:FecR domain-containing protein [Spirosoma radiotolerans]AKD54652.1 iron dicitrate transport regulator FecR [Spirosoma radiotolerans]